MQLNTHCLVLCLTLLGLTTAIPVPYKGVRPDKDLAWQPPPGARQSVTGWPYNYRTTRTRRKGMKGQKAYPVTEDAVEDEEYVRSYFACAVSHNRAKQPRTYSTDSADLCRDGEEVSPPREKTPEIKSLTCSLLIGLSRYPKHAIWSSRSPRRRTHLRKGMLSYDIGISPWYRSSQVRN